jgi:hypothetical protein
VRLAGLFLMIELFGLELVIANHAPVVTRCIHWETGRERSIYSNDHRVLAGTTVLGKVIAFPEVNHLPETRVRVHHLVSRVLFFGKPLDCLFYGWPVIFGDVGYVVGRMLEVSVLFEQWRLIVVIVGGDSIVVSNLC